VARVTSGLFASRSRMRTLVVVTAVLTVFALAPGAEASAGSSGGKVVVHSSSYGRILFDGGGFVLYAFTHDRHGHSSCSGACAKAWPPYLVKGRPSAGNGAKPSLVGVVRRADGRLQATYAGRPLYYYVGDRKPGQILCQGVSEFGGYWRVVRPNGIPVR
jgi:predicted lipoprotein with Yx(FWY)xxD motif